NGNTEGITTIVSKLESLGRDMQELKENVHAIQRKENMENLVDDFQTTSKIIEDSMKEYLDTAGERMANHRPVKGKFEECKAIFTEDGSPLHMPFYYSPEEIKYFSANSGFSNDEKHETKKAEVSEAISTLNTTHNVKLLPQKENQNISYYVEPYEPPISFPRRPEQHAEEALVYETMESLKKIG
ncbi:hypothetical protein Tco_0061475, partial [Tanacetum coccineum]